MPQSTSLLIKAVFDEDTGEVEKLLKNGTDVNAVDNQKNTALLQAVEMDTIPLAKMLLEHGANPNPQPHTVWALPLSLAIDVAVEASKWVADIVEPSLEMVQLLLHYGADINLPDDTGKTAYDYACGSSGGYHRPAQLLFEQIRQKRGLPV